jgi:cytochrome c peroxidase
MVNRSARTVGLIAPWLVLAAAIASPPATAGFVWNLPKGFPEPYVPTDNPMTAVKVDLGRYLFYDIRLSANHTQSCASCHQQRFAFTDGKKVSVGSTGQLHPRNAMSLVNVAYDAVLTWNNPNLTKLEDQALVPMFGRHPVELGLAPNARWLSPLKTDAIYRRLFSLAYPQAKDPFTVRNVTKALACFERTIISAQSPYDRYHYLGQDNAVSDSAKRGEELFFSERCACFHCHGGFDFSDAVVTKGAVDRPVEFHNNGLYNLDGPISYPPDNPGIYEHTRKPSDVGKFKAPSLRNIAVTGPYMHDGSIATLEEVVDHYAAGGRTIAGGPYAGDGSKNPNKDGRIGGFPLPPQDRQDLVAFLRSLTDTEVLHDPRFANPWKSATPLAPTLARTR